MRHPYEQGQAASTELQSPAAKQNQCSPLDQLQQSSALEPTTADNCMPDAGALHASPSEQRPSRTGQVPDARDQLAPASPPFMTATPQLPDDDIPVCTTPRDAITPGKTAVHQLTQHEIPLPVTFSGSVIAPALPQQITPSPQADEAQVNTACSTKHAADMDLHKDRPVIAAQPVVKAAQEAVSNEQSVVAEHQPLPVAEHISAASNAEPVSSTAWTDNPMFDPGRKAESTAATPVHEILKPGKAAEAATVQLQPAPDPAIKASSSPLACPALDMRVRKRC